MDTGKKQNERPALVLQQELDRLHASDLPIKLESSVLGWRVQLGDLAADDFVNWVDVVRWIRKWAPVMYPNSEYTRNLKQWYEQRKNSTSSTTKRSG